MIKHTGNRSVQLLGHSRCGEGEFTPESMSASPVRREVQVKVTADARKRPRQEQHPGLRGRAEEPSRGGAANAQPPWGTTGQSLQPEPHSYRVAPVPVQHLRKGTHTSIHKRAPAEFKGTEAPRELPWEQQARHRAHVNTQVALLRIAGNQDTVPVTS